MNKKAFSLRARPRKLLTAQGGGVPMSSPSGIIRLSPPCWANYVGGSLDGSNAAETTDFDCSIDGGNASPEPLYTLNLGHA